MVIDYREQRKDKGVLKDEGKMFFSNVNLQRMSTQQIINTGVNGGEKK